MPDQNTRGNNDTPHDDAEVQPERRDGVHATDLSRFQIDQLAAIARFEVSDATCYGIAIEEYLANYYDAEVTHPRNYKNLNTLAELGLVAQGDHDGRTNQYELTPAGRELLAERVQWLADQAGLRVVDGNASPDGGARETPLVAGEGGSAGGVE